MPLTSIDLARINEKARRRIHGFQESEVYKFMNDGHREITRRWDNILIQRIGDLATVKDEHFYNLASSVAALTGTMTFTLNSDGVVGVGTKFLTEVKPNQWIRKTVANSGPLAPNNTWVQVKTITDDLNLVLEVVYPFVTAAATPAESSPLVGEVKQEGGKPLDDERQVREIWTVNFPVLSDQQATGITVHPLSEPIVLHEQYGNDRSRIVADPLGRCMKVIYFEDEITITDENSSTNLRGKDFELLLTATCREMESDVYGASNYYGTKFDIDYTEYKTRLKFDRFNSKSKGREIDSRFSASGTRFGRNRSRTFGTVFFPFNFSNSN